MSSFHKQQNTKIKRFRKFCNFEVNFELFEINHISIAINSKVFKVSQFYIQIFFFIFSKSKIMHANITIKNIPDQLSIAIPLKWVPIHIQRMYLSMCVTLFHAFDHHSPVRHYHRHLVCCINNLSQKKKKITIARKKGDRKCQIFLNVKLKCHTKSPIDCTIICWLMWKRCTRTPMVTSKIVINI